MKLALLLGALVAAHGPAVWAGQETIHLRAAFDPQPGPYFVVTDAAGRVDSIQKTVIARALDGWTGRHLGAFKLCYRPKSAPTDWAAALTALDEVSRLLQENGATIVVVDADRACATPGSPKLAGQAHVEIMGVIAADPVPPPGSEAGDVLDRAARSGDLALVAGRDGDGEAIPIRAVEVRGCIVAFKTRSDGAEFQARVTQLGKDSAIDCTGGLNQITIHGAPEFREALVLRSEQPIEGVLAALHDIRETCRAGETTF